MFSRTSHETRCGRRTNRDFECRERARFCEQCGVIVARTRSAIPSPIDYTPSHPAQQILDHSDRGANYNECSQSNTEHLFVQKRTFNTEHQRIDLTTTSMVIRRNSAGRRSTRPLERYARLFDDWLTSGNALCGNRLVRLPYICRCTEVWLS